MTDLLETLAKNSTDNALSTQASCILRNDCETRHSIHSSAFMRTAQVASHGIFRVPFAATHTHTHTHECNMVKHAAEGTHACHGRLRCVFGPPTANFLV